MDAIFKFNPRLMTQRVGIFFRRAEGTDESAAFATMLGESALKALWTNPPTFCVGLCGGVSS